MIPQETHHESAPPAPSMAKNQALLTQPVKRPHAVSERRASRRPEKTFKLFGD